jgi:hypothetical protein
MVRAPASLSFGRHNGSRQVNVSIQVTVRNLTNAGQAYTISESDPRLSLSTSSLSVPGGGTGTFTVSLSARGSTGNVGGDVTVSGGGGTHLLPYWYSVGNTSRLTSSSSFPKQTRARAEQSARASFLPARGLGHSSDTMAGWSEKRPSTTSSRPLRRPMLPPRS